MRNIQLLLIISLCYTVTVFGQTEEEELKPLPDLTQDSDVSSGHTTSPSASEAEGRCLSIDCADQGQVDSTVSQIQNLANTIRESVKESEAFDESPIEATFRDLSEEEKRQARERLRESVSEVFDDESPIEATFRDLSEEEKRQARERVRKSARKLEALDESTFRELFRDLSEEEKERARQSLERLGKSLRESEEFDAIPGTLSEEEKERARQSLERLGKSLRESEEFDAIPGTLSEEEKERARQSLERLGKSLRESEEFEILRLWLGRPNERDGR